MKRQSTAVTPHFHLKIIREISDLLNEARDLDSILRNVVNKISESLNFEVVSIYLFDPEKRRLILRATRGLSHDSKNPISLKMDEGLTGYVYSSRRPVSIAPASKDQRYFPFPGSGEERYDNYYGIPITIQNNSLGVLVVQTLINRHIVPAEESVFEIISSRLAGLLEVADKLERLKNPSSSRKKMQVFQGKGISKGIAVGHISLFLGLFEKFAYKVSENFDEEKEMQRLHFAFQKAEEEIATLIKNLEQDKRLSEGEINIFNAHLMILRDIFLKTNILKKIQKKKIHAENAVTEEIVQIAKNFESQNEPFLRERAQDFRDIGQKILNYLIEPNEHHHAMHFKEGAILAAPNIGSSLLASLYKNKIGGIITEKGGETSHMAILAQSLGIPAVSGIENFCNLANPNEIVLVDGRTGFVFLSPDKSLIAEYQNSIPKQTNFKELIGKGGKESSHSKVKIQITANIGFPTDIELAKQYGLDQVGLFRTEFVFMQYEKWPTIQDQVGIYEKLAKNFNGSITIRTLDIGADKIPQYLSFPEEENPLLGLRSIRFSMENPLLFREQIKAILLASKNCSRFKILLPMVSNLWEVETAREILDQLKAEMSLSDSEIPQLGIMMEVPALFFQLKDYKKLIDFISVGTNDLIQYLLSVDRNSNTVRHLYSGFHPSVIRLLSDIFLKSRRMAKEISVCGEMAGSLKGILALMALGYRNFSVLPSRYHLLKHLSSLMTPKLLEQVRRKILSEKQELEIKRYLNEVLETLDPKLIELE